VEPALDWPVAGGGGTGAGERLALASSLGRLAGPAGGPSARLGVSEFAEPGQGAPEQA
jgi:hypothetical protein